MPSRSGSDRSGSDRANGEAKPPFEMRFTLPQVVVLWSVIAGTMVMVFLFGLYAGREQGVQTALEERGGDTDAIRLPVSGVARNASPESASPDIATLTTSVAPAAEVLSATAAEKLAANTPSNSSAAGAKEGTQPALGAEKVASLIGDPSAGTPKDVQAKDPKPSEIAAVAEEEGLPSLSAEKARRGGGASEGAVPPSVPAVVTSGSKPTVVAKAEKTANAKADAGKAEAAKADAAKNAKALADQAKTVASTSMSPGWYLQVAAARTKAEGIGIIQKLQKNKLSPRLEEARVGPNVYYRVVLGPYADKDQALAYRSRVKASGAVNGDPFLKNVR